MKILHVLYVSIPTIDGSSTRSLDIVSSQKDIGLEPIVVTSPFQRANNSKSEYELINGIKYYRTFINSDNMHSSEDHSSLLKRIAKLFLIIKFIINIYKISKKEKVDIIHAHSTFFCGISAKITGVFLSKPVIYEVRSLWEERQKDSTSKIQRYSAEVITKFETFSMKISDRIIVINKNLLENVRNRNIKNNKISVIPNAVNLVRIEDKVNKNIITLNTSNYITFGYIGNISNIEGIIDLCKVFQELENENINNKLLIYGQGPELNNVKEFVKLNDLKNVRIMGSIQNSDIYKAFEKIDIIINPRVKSKITDTVTPLKPLEAMGYKKLVIASDVGGMKELITHNETGLLYSAGNNLKLKELIKNVIQDSKKYIHIIDNAYEYVKNEKSWHANAISYFDIYKGLK